MEVTEEESEILERLMEIIQSEKSRKEKSKQNHKDLWDNIKSCNICFNVNSNLLEFPKEKWENGAKKKLKK